MTHQTHEHPGHEPHDSTAGHDSAQPDHDHTGSAGHDHSGGHQHGSGHTHTHAADGAADEIAECPVMPGSTVNKADAEELGLVRDYAGTRYYFCCTACGPLWDAEPAKYANA